MTAAAAQALRSLAPPPRPELLSLDLPRYDPAGSGRVDLAMVGGGPAVLAVAQRVAEAGLSVCSIDPSPDLVWPNNYGVWVDEFDAMGLSDCLDTVWPSASVFITAKSLDRPYARVARRKLKSTMMERCVAHGVRFHQAKVVKAVHDEASSLLVCDNGRRTGGRQREFFCFGMDVLLKLDLEGTRRFFNAFFDLEPHYWQGFLSSRLFLSELMMFGLSLFGHASNPTKLEIMAKGTVPLAKMVGNLIQDRDR